MLSASSSCEIKVVLGIRSARRFESQTGLGWPDFSTLLTPGNKTFVKPLGAFASSGITEEIVHNAQNCENYIR